MGDLADDFRAMRDYRREKRAALGVNCPMCATARPKAHPSILLPNQRCKVDGYRDPRSTSITREWEKEYHNE